MLYSLETAVNHFIREHFPDGVVAKSSAGEPEELRFIFMQCKEIDEAGRKGLLISTGYDEWHPPSTLKVLDGEIVLNHDKKRIEITSERGRVFHIVEANEREKVEISREYEGTYQDEDIEYMKKHIEWFKKM